MAYRLFGQIIGQYDFVGADGFLINAREVIIVTVGQMNGFAQIKSKNKTDFRTGAYKKPHIKQVGSFFETRPLTSFKIAGHIKFGLIHIGILDSA